MDLNHVLFHEDGDLLQLISTHKEPVLNMMEKCNLATVMTLVDRPLHSVPNGQARICVGLRAHLGVSSERSPALE